MTKAAIKHLPNTGAIINTTPVTAYKGAPQLLDYSATKGAIVAFTRSLSQSLIKKGIRVNAVAPGPIWTPLIVQTKPKEQVDKSAKMSQCNGQVSLKNSHPLMFSWPQTTPHIWLVMFFI